ncbi:hypothetical protein IWW47_006504, partial [Coemansia sp. RSA 2052]
LSRPASVAAAAAAGGAEAVAPRRLSLVRTVAESIGRRSVSAESSSSAPAKAQSPPKPKPSAVGRAWTFGGLRGRPEAPIVSTDTSEARGTHVQVHAAIGREAEDVAEAMPEAAPEAVPEVAQRRRSVRVGRSEVRRLSASLRSIGLGDPSSHTADDALQLEPIVDNDSDDSGSDAGSGGSDSGGDGERHPPSAHASDEEASGGSDSGDEAEALVIGRAVMTPAPGDLFLDERLALVERSVSRTTHQMAIVRALMRQAASRHRAHEQRVLRASYRDLRREALAGAEQQRVYARSAADHVLSPQRTRVHIPRAIVDDAAATTDDAAQQKPHV